MSRRRGRQTDLAARLDGLREAVRLAEGRADEAGLAPGRAVLTRAGERSALSLEHTVVVLAGATGSGKSSLFNRLVGLDLSATGVRRPTTDTTHACVWGEGAGPLLEWLQVPRQHWTMHESALTPERDPELDGLVLLDLPDFDSTERAHRVEVDRLVELADLFVWVLDPQKYADAAVHDGYLRRLATHRDVMLVVLNQVDRLDARGQVACLADLHRLLGEDGLAGVPLLATSAVTGEGVDDLRVLLGERVRATHAALHRLAADIDAAVAPLAPLCAGRAEAKPDAGSRELLAALASAAGADAVAAAAAASYRMEATRRTGWPVTRWLARLRPDPLRRLHLGRGAAGRTSLPAPTPVQRARIGNALRALADARSAGLPGPWRDAVRSAAVAAEGGIADDLDAAVRSADVSRFRRPRWWSAVGGIQVVLLVAALAGLGWLALLAAFAYFHLPPPPMVHVRRAPLPTVLALGGLGLGVLVAFGARWVAAVAAGRRAARVRRSLQRAVAGVAESAVLAPVSAVLADQESLCAALRRAAGT